MRVNELFGFSMISLNYVFTNRTYVETGFGIK